MKKLALKPVNRVVVEKCSLLTRMVMGYVRCVTNTFSILIRGIHEQSRAD